MLRDRGTKKWVSLMLPEHVKLLRKSLLDETKIAKPILDEQEIDTLEIIVLSAIENDHPLLFSIYKEGVIKTISGKVTFIDHIQKQFRVKDNSEITHFIPFNDVINIEIGDNP